MTPARQVKTHAPASFNTAERLRAFMEAHGLGVKELAELLCTSPQTLEAWFEDGMVAPPACLLALALALGTPARLQKEQVFPANSNSLAVRRSDAAAKAHANEEALRMVRAI
jgi:transcriptional regulator with XRE-family HTH domain